jgi:hypothetical protein
MTSPEVPRRKTTNLRAAPILSALKRHGVDFVTIGSYGAILQEVDLPMTDIDIVPKDTRENRRRLVAALDELDARELVGDTEETLDKLRSNPDSMGDSAFRMFVTVFGGVDVVLRPAGFPNGYDDLIENAWIATVQDELEPEITVDAKIADARDIYNSKQQAGRRKDIEALPAFIKIHVTDVRKRLRDRYQDQDEQRRGDGPPTN